MANTFTSIAVSPNGSTLLNALQVTTTAGTVLNEVVSIGDPSTSANVASVTATGALSVTGTLVATQATATALNVTIGNLPATQTVTGTVAVAASQTITAAQATAANLNATVIGTVTAAQATAGNLNATVVGTVTANAGTGTLAVSAATLPMATGAGTLSYGQVVITTAATQIIAAAATRKSLVVCVLNNGANMFIGDASVATNTGCLLLGVQGANFSLPTTAAVYAIAAGAATSNAVSFLEMHS